LIALDRLPHRAAKSFHFAGSPELVHFSCSACSPAADGITASVVQTRGQSWALRDDRLREGAGSGMDISTPRFGTLTVLNTDVLHLEQGLIGLRHCRRWVVLADAQNPALGWLQSIDSPDVALGVVSPRRFVPDYQLRVARKDLAPLELPDARDAQVVVIVSRHDEGLALNLRAPLVINVEARRGRQVIAKDPLPVRLILPTDGEMRLTA
jgi:flagellar assembly factor FliW